MPTAGIYTRISSDRDGQQLGVRRQVADCEALAARKGWTVSERYVFALHRPVDVKRRVAHLPAIPTFTGAASVVSSGAGAGARTRLAAPQTRRSDA
ncbi:MAG: site-specific recombinase [Mycobacterium sp.]|nr:site-specific recombinase [Mycobacterium sp.]